MRQRNRLQPLQFVVSPPQKTIFESPVRFRTVSAGRRFGKTFLAKYELLRAALQKPHATIWYVAPTYRQAKELMWGPLKDFVPASYVKKKNETELSMTLINGSVIKLKGADNPDSLRGNALDFIVIDEAAFMAKYVWEVVYPALADHAGNALFITTPSGFNWFYDLCMDNKEDPDWAFFHYTTEEGGNVAKEELERAKRNMDARMYRQEFEASFENLAGRVYYAFSFDNNAKSLDSAIAEAKNPSCMLHVGMDFNVNPMTAAIGVKIGDQLHVIDEIVMGNGNTDLMISEIRNRYPKNTICVYPDPTANQRRTSAEYGVTDFVLLQRAGFNVISPGHSYALKDRINTTNTALLDAAGTTRLFFHKKTTTNIQKGYMGLTYIEGTSIPDKNLNLEHVLDAVGYMVMWLLPMESTMRRVKVLGA